MPRGDDPVEDEHYADALRAAEEVTARWKHQDEIRKKAVADCEMFAAILALLRAKFAISDAEIDARLIQAAQHVALETPGRADWSALIVALGNAPDQSSARYAVDAWAAAQRAS